MLRLRQGWVGFIGDFLAFGPLLWRYAIKPMLGLFSLGGDIDFYIQHSHDSGWVGVVINWLEHPFIQLAVLIVGLGLILWDIRNARYPNQSGGDRFHATGTAGKRLQQRTWTQRVQPIHVITFGLIIALAGVLWQYMQLQTPQSVVATHIDLGPQPQIPAAVKTERIADYDLNKNLELIDRWREILKSDFPRVSRGDGFIPLRNWRDDIRKNGANVFLDKITDYRDKWGASLKSISDESSKYEQYPDLIKLVDVMDVRRQMYSATNDLIEALKKLPPDAKNLDYFQEQSIGMGMGKLDTAAFELSKWAMIAANDLLKRRQQLTAKN